MENNRRNFVKKALAGTTTLYISDFFTGFSRKAYSRENILYQERINTLLIKDVQHKGDIDLESAEELLESSTEFQSIETINWAEYPYKPEVRFKIAYCQNQILLKYYVKEETILAKEIKINGDVYKDSCVEFFISTQKDRPYYNFEFNCIGIPSVGYGQARENRVSINPEILKLIKTKSSLGNQPFEEKTGGYQWEMMIIIPKECLTYDKDIELKGLHAKANFYKCGDETSKPHFVTWNPIHTKSPDYHQPTYFGVIGFE